MRTFAVLAIFAIIMIAVQNLPDEISNLIGLVLITGTLIGLILGIVSVGKKAR